MISRKFFRYTIGIFLLLLAFLRPMSAEARLGGPMSQERVVQMADVLVVAEVVETKQIARIAKAGTHWHIPLWQMNARIRIKRSLALTGDSTIPDGEIIVIPYCAIDWESEGNFSDGPMFPSLSPGDVFVFPLKKVKEPAGRSWQLIQEEDFGLLTPAVLEPLPVDGNTMTGIGFLCRELAGALVKGNYKTVFKASEYLGETGHSATRLAEAYKIVENQTGKDQDRWLTIAVACYASSTGRSDRATITELVKQAPSGDFRTQETLVALALSHIDKNGLDDRIIGLSIKQYKTHSWNTAGLLAHNYPRHPTTIKLLAEVLKTNDSEAVYIAKSLIRDNTHPLLPEAIEAAVNVIRQPVKPNYSGFGAACELIRDYGDQKAFEALLNEFKLAQNKDLPRYKSLWGFCCYAKTPRFLQICEMLINDQRLSYNDSRFCDNAAWGVGIATGEDFGCREAKTVEERSRCVEKAKDYLAKHHTTSNMTTR